MAQLNFIATSTPVTLADTPEQQIAFAAARTDPGPDMFPPDCTLSADQRSLLGQHSSFVGLMDTPALVIEHWEFVAQARAQQQAAQQSLNPADATAERNVVKEQQLQRKAQLQAQAEAARIAWKEAIEDRKRIVAQLDESIRELHDAYSEARAAAMRPLKQLT